MNQTSHRSTPTKRTGLEDIVGQGRFRAFGLGDLELCALKAGESLVVTEQAPLFDW